MLCAGLRRIKRKARTRGGGYELRAWWPTCQVHLVHGPGAVFHSTSPFCFCFHCSSFRHPGFEWISEEALSQIVAWGTSEIDDMVASVPVSSSKEIYLHVNWRHKSYQLGVDVFLALTILFTAKQLQKIYYTDTAAMRIFHVKCFISSPLENKCNCTCKKVPQPLKTLLFLLSF